MSGRALIVDDNRSLAEDLGEILAAEGYEVQVFHDPLEALRRAPELRFDVAVLDVRMPGIDGVALHRELQASHPHSFFVLMTAYTEDDRLGFDLALHDQLLLEQFGTRAHLLLKPFSPLSLLDILGKVRGDGS